MVSDDARDDASDYRHNNNNTSLGYIYPAVLKALRRHKPPVVTVFEIGCGTGDAAKRLVDDGFSVLATDPSLHAIELAISKYPELHLELASAYDRLSASFGQWDAVITLEVVEHLYRPRGLAKAAYDLLRPGGLLVISTPFHGYWKNLALALTGRMDHHFMALQDHGHIKFWSERTISELLGAAGFHSISIKRVGRLPAIAKSMVVTAQK